MSSRTEKEQIKKGIRKNILITLLVSVHLDDLQKPLKESIT